MNYLQTFVVPLLFILCFINLEGFQVITEELKKMDATGNHDLCYYNNKCEKPSGSFFGILAINNVWSNIGYVVVGLGIYLFYFLFVCLFNYYDCLF